MKEYMLIFLVQADTPEQANDNVYERLSHGGEPDECYIQHSENQSFHPMSVLSTLKNCQAELRGLHGAIAKFDPKEYGNCSGGCPTLTYATQCSIASDKVRTVIDRLEAWRDNAALMLKQAKSEDEQKWINEKRNYQALITLLKGTD